ncbi:MAG: hypothetical protein JXR96_00275 [Deltaproteobacteria bacterium]|nr:hypothetical protein [Deltaproteobacteria bacterium]
MHRLSTCAAAALVAGLTPMQACGPPATHPCDGVVCESPPADTCIDAQRLLRYSPDGRCDPASGRCEYPAVEVDCPQGCVEGRCLNEDSVWGWIGVLENRDAMLGIQLSDWIICNEVQARFARAPHWRRALSHQIWSRRSPLLVRGTCSLYEEQAQDEPYRCMPQCDFEIQDCVEQSGAFSCQALPASLNAGPLSVQGLTVGVELEPDAYDRYSIDALPDELFERGELISASASGGQLPEPISLQVRGVANLELLDEQVELSKGKTVSVSWVPADPGSRIRVCLESTYHYPCIPRAAIVCEAPDEDGRVEIDSELVDGLMERLDVFMLGTAMRYDRAEQPIGAERVELFCGSVRGILVDLRL